MINTRNTQSESIILTERLIEEINVLLDLGTYGADGKLYDLKFNPVEKDREKFPETNWEIAMLKYNCLIILNSLAHGKNIEDLSSRVDSNVLKNNMDLIYQQIRVNKNLNYTADLFDNILKKPSANNKNEFFLIENGFLAYFVYAQISKDSILSEYNVVQQEDEKSLYFENIDFLSDTWYEFRRLFQKRTMLLTPGCYSRISKNKSLIFFEKHSSHIELNLNGRP